MISISLVGMNFALFGLGNKKYEHFNEIGFFVNNNLAKMGDNRYHKLGLGERKRISFLFLNTLVGMSFAVFGLGNKRNKHYDEMEIFVDKKLAKMGCYQSPNWN